jgi:hypothetical protein
MTQFDLILIHISGGLFLGVFGIHLGRFLERKIINWKRVARQNRIFLNKYFHRLHEALKKPL